MAPNTEETIYFLVDGVILIVSQVAYLWLTWFHSFNNQRPLCILNRGKRSVQHMRGKEADKEKKQRNVLGSSTCLFYLAGQELSQTQLNPFVS